MKLRMRSNSIRLRLTKTEVHTLVSEGSISETMTFGPEPHEQFVYTLACGEVDSADYEYWPGSLEVVLPLHAVADWATSDRIGFYESFNVGDAGELKVHVEKDFKCLTDREGEDEADAFPNPNSSVEQAC